MEPEIWGQRPLWECLAWALSQDLSLPPWGPCAQISLPSRPSLGWRAVSPECRTGDSLRVPGWGMHSGWGLELGQILYPSGQQPSVHYTHFTAEETEVRGEVSYTP